ncbi:hypothetical protein GCM10023169_34350 [Georgenia halophila]|uniref:CBM-cenC domain-containing protein n=1 Tax=Georgenia halophila TaxID=620889 RepID=A0ABP8LJ94_9MICO
MTIDRDTPRPVTAEVAGTGRGVSRRALLSGALGAGFAVGVLGTRAQAAPSGSSENLIPNPGFEELNGALPARWHPFSTASASGVTSALDPVRSGRRSMRIEDPSTSLGVGMRSSEVPVTPGRMYEASVFAFVEDGQASLYLEFWDAGGARTRFEFRVSTQLGTWQRIDVGAVAPDDAVSATVLMYQGASNTGAASFDDACLLGGPGPDVELFGPASLTAAVRGAAVQGGSVFLSSRYNTPEGKLRLGEFDLSTGQARAVDDLDIDSSGGHTLAGDGRYLYIGPAGSPHVWRFDPSTKELRTWALAGSSTTWYYDMVVAGDSLYVGTYPDCAIRRIRLSDASVSTYGRVSSSRYATAVAVDGDDVYGGSGAPGTLLRWPKDGGEPTDLSAHLSDSPVGILDLVVSGGTVYAASGREVISFERDGSGRVSRQIPREDRYIDRLTLGADGKVYALARLTTNLYEVTATGLRKIARPLDDVENQLLAPDASGGLAGVSGLGHVWTMVADGTVDVWHTATRGFGYPEVVQSMLLSGRQRVWIGGHYAMTVHHPARGTSDRFDINGEPKALAEGPGGEIYAGLYPSTQVVSIDPKRYEITVLATLGHEQLRIRAMHVDPRRRQLLVASGPAATKHTGALTFLDLRTGEVDVRRDYLPEQSVMDIAVAGRIAYLVGDTHGEATSGPLRPVAQVAAVDIDSRELLWREEIEDWASYESVHVVGSRLYAMARRPRGFWYAYDLHDGEMVAQGDLGGYGQLAGDGHRVFSWVHWSGDICELTGTDEGTRTLYDDVPIGWYNDPAFNLSPAGRATWGMYGTDLARFPLPRRSR